MSTGGKFTIVLVLLNSVYSYSYWDLLYLGSHLHLGSPLRLSILFIWGGRERYKSLNHQFAYVYIYILYWA